MTVPAKPKIFHIVHVDNLLSIITDGYLWCDAEMAQRRLSGTSIGMKHIKQRRLKQTLTSFKNLSVGNCVPFYFCPRSVMLYLIYKQNYDDLDYRGGQEAIIHLEADLQRSIEWATKNELRWTFTLQNAGSKYFEDRCDLAQLDEIDWVAVASTSWSDNQTKERKQAEFLIEHRFPWQLIERIGLQSTKLAQQVADVFSENSHRPKVDIKPEWYY
ncbi:MAG: hypothetical protein K940chlam9_01566 [Chlamydiae bacterium]|nr:hypothetical protein [Chlamydiota bacterium]